MNIAAIIMGLFTFVASLFGCGHKGDPQILDGPGMVYVDRDYRSVYANALVFDWDGAEGYPMFAVAYLGKGEDAAEKRDTYLHKAFPGLSDEELAKIKHFDFSGDEWYLIVPRYDYSDVVNTDTGEKTTLYEGEAFTTNCKGNLMVEDYTHGGHKYVPMLDESGVLIVSEDAVDINNNHNVYKVDYCGAKDLYKGAKDSYKAGQTVTVYFYMVATDTDYRFYLDGEPLNPVEYTDENGFEISFVMPEHDVKLECISNNSMEYYE